MHAYEPHRQTSVRGGAVSSQLPLGMCGTHAQASCTAFCPLLPRLWLHRPRLLSFAAAESVASCLQQSLRKLHACKLMQFSPHLFLQ